MIRFAEQAETKLILPGKVIKLLASLSAQTRAALTPPPGGPAFPQSSQQIRTTQTNGGVIPIMENQASPANTLLRIIALVGTGAILLWQALTLPHLEPRQDSGFTLLTLVALGVGVTLMLFMKETVRGILLNLDLLVPLGLFIVASDILNRLLLIPVLAALLTPEWPVKLFTLSFSISASFVLNLVLSVIYVGWTTCLILQAVILGHVRLEHPLSIVGRWFWRTLALEFFGWGILLIVSAGLIATSLFSVRTSNLFALASLSLLWNLATAAVLPVALADSKSFWESLRHGIAVSFYGLPKWAHLILIQMILLGWVTFIHVSYTTYEAKSSTTRQAVSGLNADTERITESYSNSQTEHTKQSWGVNSFWIGGYNDGCKWYEDLMKVLEAKRLQFVESLLTLLFAIFAIAIKFSIVNSVYRPKSIEDETTRLNLSG